MSSNFKALWDKAWAGAERRQWIYGRLGRVNDDATITIRVSHRPDFVYVRMGVDGDQGIDIARNRGVPLRPGLPVRMKVDAGTLTVYGVDDALMESDPNAPATTSGVAKHTHKRGSGLEYELEAERFAPGRVISGGGLSVYINPFRYYHGGVWETWPGGYLNLAAYRPATAGHHAWVLVGIDPATNTAVAATGSSVVYATALAYIDLDAIAFGGYIPCGAIDVRDDDLILTDITDYIDAHGWYNGGPRSKVTSDIILNTVGTPTRDSLQDYIDTTGSKGFIDGGVITDAGGGTVDVSAGEGYLRITDDDTALIQLVEWPAVTGQVIPTDDFRYIYVAYNAGMPQVEIRTAVTDAEDEFILGYVVNEGGVLHIFAIGNSTIAGVRRVQRMLSRGIGVIRSQVGGGNVLGETGTRNITVTAGTFYSGVLEFDVPLIDTSLTDTFDLYYRDGIGGFTKVAAQTQWPNTQYDDGSGTLADMTINRYGVLWIYRELDGHVVMLYGTSNVPSLSGAETEPPPTALPLRLQRLSILLGRFIYRKSEATAEEIQSAFTEQFATTPITTFLNLSDTPSTFVAQGGKLAAVNAGETAVEFVGLGAKIAAATEKATPVDADNLALADSAASNVLKRLTWANLKATLKAYTDTLYLVLAGSVAQTVTGVKTFTGRIDLPAIRANSAAGVRIEDDAGNLGVFVADGGNLGIGTSDIEAWASSNRAVQLSSHAAILWGHTVSSLLLIDNLYYDGAWKRRTAASGAWLGIANGEVSVFTADSGLADAIPSLSRRFVVQNGGNVGIGVTPQAPFHVHDGVGGAMFVAKTGIVGTAVTLLANGSGDVVRQVKLHGVAYETVTPGSYNVDMNLNPGSSQTIQSTPLGQTLTLACAADGSITAQQTAGAATWTLSILAVWL